MDFPSVGAFTLAYSHLLHSTAYIVRSFVFGQSVFRQLMFLKNKFEHLQDSGRQRLFVSNVGCLKLYCT